MVYDAGNFIKKERIMKSKRLEQLIVWLCWAVVFTAFGYWWAWKAMGGGI